ncbi:hypothetical protein MMC07_009867 [Pseudocyphellaria aurata]|nr:hypothetical protein [Pseudocyphellaria aurata]
MENKIFFLREHLSFIDSALRFTLRTILPLLFFTVLLIAGTLIIFCTFYQHMQLPEHFTLAVSLTFGLLIILTAFLLLFLRVRRFYQRRARIDSDVETGPSPLAFKVVPWGPKMAAKKSTHRHEPAPVEEKSLHLSGREAVQGPTRLQEPRSVVEDSRKTWGSETPTGLGIRSSPQPVSDGVVSPVSNGPVSDGAVPPLTPSPPPSLRISRPGLISPGSRSPPPFKGNPSFHLSDSSPPITLPPKATKPIERPASVPLRGWWEQEQR